MKKILFVCHGNICRSVMAEMVMRHLVAEAGREDEFVIDSCATSREEIGNDIYPPAKRCLSAHGVPFTRHAARQITKEDYANFDLILCMEEYNIRNLRQTLGMALLEEDARKAEPKIGRLLDRDVADPWYTDRFDVTYRDIEEGCEAWLDRLIPQALGKEGKK